MEEMAERVPGVTYKESRTLSADDALGVGGRHIKISFADPDFACGDARIGPGKGYSPVTTFPSQDRDLVSRRWSSWIGDQNYIWGC